ncbi:MAG: ParB N-terminal domain-containing protein [Fibrobacteria bacterium]|nr:ParB N-terminal domain-containing protein [Fibrobacteria bacterium]
MQQTVEINQIDIRYAHLRLRDKHREQMLLTSILEQGILDPLYVVNAGSTHILLDGHKRYRCALKVGIQELPVTTLDDNEVTGILKLIRLSTSKGMSQLEEASLVDELHQHYGLSSSEIARRLERSVSWVSIRLGMLSQMSLEVRSKIFSGQFPVRSYMYTLRPFTRVNTSTMKKEVESFVKNVSGRHYSTRDIELLAGAWFKGTALQKAQIQEGNLDWLLRQLKLPAESESQEHSDLNEIETRVLSNLEILIAYVFKLSSGLDNEALTRPEFYNRCQGPVGRLLKLLDDFKTHLQEFYDRCTKTSSSTDTVPGR